MFLWEFCALHLPVPFQKWVSHEKLLLNLCFRKYFASPEELKLFVLPKMKTSHVSHLTLATRKLGANLQANYVWIH